METASCPLLNTLHLTITTTANTNNNNGNTCKFYKIPRNHLHPISSFPLNFPRNTTFTSKKLHFSAYSSSPSTSNGDQNPSPQLAVLLEVEGVLMDVYRSCNRQAFNAGMTQTTYVGVTSRGVVPKEQSNVSFRKLGLDCANWTEPVYLDLLRKSTGDEERMLALYFNRIGWPTSVPTSEEGKFVKSLLREKKNAVDDLVMSENSTLRPGVVDFIDDACREDVPVVILTAYSKSGEKVARSIVEKLGHDRISKIKIVGNEEVKKSFYGQLVFGKGVSSSLEEQLAKEATKAASAEKRKIAEEVASLLKLSVQLDTSSAESIQSVVAALRAGAEYADVPVDNCVLVAGSQSGVVGAERIGMPCIVLRSSLTARAEFPSANAVMDGFGGADLTISRLCRKRST